MDIHHSFPTKISYPFQVGSKFFQDRPQSASPATAPGAMFVRPAWILVGHRLAYSLDHGMAPIVHTRLDASARLNPLLWLLWTQTNSRLEVSSLDSKKIRPQPQIAVQKLNPVALGKADSTTGLQWPHSLVEGPATIFSGVCHFGLRCLSRPVPSPVVFQHLCSKAKMLGQVRQLLEVFSSRQCTAKFDHVLHYPFRLNTLKMSETKWQNKISFGGIPDSRNLYVASTIVQT